jgi:hypothetical protein
LTIAREFVGKISHPVVQDRPGSRNIPRRDIDFELTRLKRIRFQALEVFIDLARGADLACFGVSLAERFQQPGIVRVTGKDWGRHCNRLSVAGPIR